MARGAAVPTAMAATSPSERRGNNRRMRLRTWWVVGFCVTMFVTWLFIISFVRICSCSRVFVGLTFILVRERICPPLTDARFQEQRPKELFFDHCFPASRVDGIRHCI